MSNSGEKQPKQQFPTDLQPFMEKFVADHNDSAKCGFVMMRLERSKFHSAVFKAIQDTCKPHGLKALRADQKRYSADLLANVRTYMHGCSFGIAIFERVARNKFNPNVSIEVGYMMALGKPVCLLRDKALDRLHSDLVGRLYETFDSRWVGKTIKKVLEGWLRETGIIKPRPPMENKILNTLFVQQVNNHPTGNPEWQYILKWDGPDYPEYLRAKGKLRDDGFIQENEKELVNITDQGFCYCVANYLYMKEAGRWWENTPVNKENMRKILDGKIGPKC